MAPRKWRELPMPKRSGLRRLLDAAEARGDEYDNSDYQIAPLRDMLFDAWELLTPRQRLKLYEAHDDLVVKYGGHGDGGDDFEGGLGVATSGRYEVRTWEGTKLHPNGEEVLGVTPSSDKGTFPSEGAAEKGAKKYLQSWKQQGDRWHAYRGDDGHFYIHVADEFGGMTDASVQIVRKG